MQANCLNVQSQCDEKLLYKNLDVIRLNLYDTTSASGTFNVSFCIKAIWYSMVSNYI